MNSFLYKQLDELNENQLKAVKHVDKPLFVVAGAGTGKTKTLTTKIAYLLKELNVDPENILAVTFTNKAAKEIRTRINEMIYPYQMGSWLYTFHAFGLKILREHAVDLNLGYRNDFTIIDSDESKDLIRDILKKLKIESKDLSLGYAKEAISRHKMMIESIFEPLVTDVYREYKLELIKNNLMDFDDLIRYVLDLFEMNELILTKYQKQFKYVLVDEFQDTDKVQYEIIKLINSKNTFVVGDPDQSIYHFRGARYLNNELFIKEFEAEVIILDENYRSTNNILKAANNVITKNIDRTTSKELKSNLGLGNEIFVKRFNNDLDEVDFVLDEITRLNNRGVPFNDIAVLYRNNALSRNFEHKLVQRDIPYVLYGGLSFYQRKEVKDILAYLKIVIDSNNDFFFKRVVNRPKRGIGNVTLEKLEEYSNISNISMFEAIDFVNLPTRTLNSLKEFKEIIIKIKEGIRGLENIREVVGLIYDLANYSIELEADNEETRKNRIDNINELKTVFSMGDSTHHGTNLEKIKLVLDDLALLTDQEVVHEEADSIKLATVHQVKGLEFKVVFVVALEEEIFPNHRSIEQTSKLEEERRLFYVAVTRAKEYLYLTSSLTRRLYGSFHYTRESRFINEVVNLKTFSENKEASKPVANFNNKTEFKEADVINHISFGKGIVVSINGDVLTVAFNSDHGIKKIKSTFEGINKEE